MPETLYFVSFVAASPRIRAECSTFLITIGRIVLSSKLPWDPANATAASSPRTWMQTMIIASSCVGFTLPGMIELPGSLSGSTSSWIPVRGPDPSQRRSFAIFINETASARSAPLAATQGNFELNAMRPVIINNFLHSATILADACGKLREYCIEGTELHRDQIDDYVNRSLMLVTALSPVIGYDKASAIAHKANDEGTTLREAALASGYVSAEEFVRVVVPRQMVGRPASTHSAGA